MRVPFLDLTAQQQEIAGELRAAVSRVAESGWYVLGPEVEAFESEFAAYCGVRHCVGVANGLDAIELILRAHGIGAGDEVIVPAMTFVATWLGVTLAGATPVPVDIRADTRNIDVDHVAAAVTPRSRAILAVHLYGTPAPMAALRQIADRSGLVLIEDAAQAHGARLGGGRAGALGDAAAFSFYPTKNLGAWGDGGAILTQDDRIAAAARRLRNYGSDVKYHHEVVGRNSRLDELQAAILRVKLTRLDPWNALRRAVASGYAAGIKDLDIEFPAPGPECESAWHLFVIRHPRRDELRAYLSERGIETMIHYPVPPHLQPCYAGRFAGAAFPVSERHASQALSLPMCPSLGAAQRTAVIEALAGFAGGNGIATRQASSSA